MPNTSAGTTAVLRSFPLQTGDSILITDHTYAAARLAALEAARNVGATVQTAAVPLAAADHAIVAAIVAAVTPQTRLAIIDHITSPTAAIWPVGLITQALQERGVAVLIDAAHAPGMIPVNVSNLAADFWVGNFQKWAFSGLAIGALVVAPRWRGVMRSPIVSHDNELGFPVSFEAQGTLDCTVIGTLAAALSLVAECDGPALSERNCRVAERGAAALATATGGSVVEGARRGSMTLVALPAGVAPTPDAALQMQEHIEDSLSVQTAVVSWHGKGYLRLSVQGYVSTTHVQRFATLLSEYGTLAAGR